MNNYTNFINRIDMKTYKLLFLAIAIFASCTITAQVAVTADGSSADGSAMLEVKSTDKGFLPPRMTETEIGNIASPANGLMVFNTTDNKVYVFVSTDNEWKEVNYGTGTIAGPFICGNTFIDDRNSITYSTILIGTQCWMAENLNYDQSSYGNDWCYDDTPAYCDTYGRMYDWAAVMQGASSSSSNPSGVQGVCPAGWHVPSDEEWTELTTYVGNNGYSGTEGTALKSTSGWNSGGNGTDNFGFTALPGGFRNGFGNAFDQIGNLGLWWGATEAATTHAFDRSMTFETSIVNNDAINKQDGFSVRCLSD